MSFAMIEISAFRVDGRIAKRSVFRQAEAIPSCLKIDKDVYESCEMVGQAQELNGRIKPCGWSVLMGHNSRERSYNLFGILFTFQRFYTAEFNNE
jgi:hypothetical protein